MPGESGRIRARTRAQRDGQPAAERRALSRSGLQLDRAAQGVEAISHVGEARARSDGGDVESPAVVGDVEAQHAAVLA